MANHPQHHHALYLIDLLTLYQGCNRKWKGDNCGTVYDRTNTPYHCEICKYDLHSFFFISIVYFESSLNMLKNFLVSASKYAYSMLKF